jgi:hypothetical protein|tara:strand:- start:5996 stop:6211 length:216 start_codon:yes stop_codon:yes gene_type:complete
MFILVVVGVVDTNFDVTEEDRVVGELPDFLLGLFVSVTRRFLLGMEEATIEDLVTDDNVGDEHVLDDLLHF